MRRKAQPVWWGARAWRATGEGGRGRRRRGGGRTVAVGAGLGRQALDLRHELNAREVHRHVDRDVLEALAGLVGQRLRVVRDCETEKFHE